MNGPITTTVRAFLEGNGYSFDYVEDKHIFRTGFTLKNCKMNVILDANDEANYLFCHCAMTDRLGSNNVVALTRALNDINQSTRFTTMCVDPADGEIVCHSGINTDGTSLSTDQLMGLLQMCAATLDENADKLRAIAAGAAPDNCN